MNGISEITIKEFLLWLLRKRKRMRVTGNSMLPLFKPGEEILINPQAYKKSLPKIGDVVVTFLPQEQHLPIVKRITAIMDDGSCFLAGDNLAVSSNSNSFGTIAVRDILGQVTCRFDIN